MIFYLCVTIVKLLRKVLILKMAGTIIYVSSQSTRLLTTIRGDKMARPKQFKAESKKLLDMMINSIYTHKEIFLRELISNASDAIDKLYFTSLTNSDVKLAREDFKIAIRADKENRTLTISDNGIGMSGETLQHIFEKFYQGDSSRKSEGNGIGLALVKKILDLCEGSISVTSAPGQGSTFKIFLPNEL